MWNEILIFIATLLGVQLLRAFFRRRAIHRSLKERGIPGPEPALIRGSMSELRATPDWNVVIDRWIDTYGNIFGFYMGPERFIVINDVELIKDVMITHHKDFRDRPPPTIDAYPYKHSVIYLAAERWGLVRKAISPAFSHAKVTSQFMTRQIDACVDTLMEYIGRELAASQHSTVEVYNRIQAFTMDVIARSALNMSESRPHEPDDKLMNNVREYMAMAQNFAVDLAHVLPFFQPALAFVNNNLTAGRATDQIIAHLRKEIKQTVATNESEDKNNMLFTLLVRLNRGEISADELIANAHIVLLAGYETTANALTFTLWLLAKHRDIQTRLRADIKDHNGGIGSPYLEQVWMESLRILPPVTGFVTRVAHRDITLHGTQFVVGDRVMAPVWRVHHDPDVWPDPNRFDPDRFSPANRAHIHPAAFLTFGLGPRYCLGVQLAHHEAKLVIARIISQYDLSLIAGVSVDPIPLHVPTVIINPAAPVNIQFTKLHS